MSLAEHFVDYSFAFETRFPLMPYLLSELPGKVFVIIVKITVSKSYNRLPKKQNISVHYNATQYNTIRNSKCIAIHNITIQRTE